MKPPTPQTYDELELAYQHFNAALFHGALPPCLLTLQRKSRTHGYFSADRFVARDDRSFTDEIALNPEYFAIHSCKHILSTLAHEMVHLWQRHFGQPGRGRYHNTEWARRMDAIGLTPSNTGAPGGRRTGDQMTHYIVAGGPFDASCDQLLTHEYTLSWMDRFPPMGAVTPLDPVDLVDLQGVLEPRSPDDRTNRTKYRCPVCAAQVWGKPGLLLRCDSCASTPRFVEA